MALRSITWGVQIDEDHQLRLISLRCGWMTVLMSNNEGQVFTHDTILSAPMKKALNGPPSGIDWQSAVLQWPGVTKAKLQAISELRGLPFQRVPACIDQLDIELVFTKGHGWDLKFDCFEDRYIFQARTHPHLIGGESHE